MRAPVLALACLAGCGVLARAEPPPDVLRESFDPGWRSRWSERTLRRWAPANRLDVETDAGDPAALRVESQASASALWRSLDVPAAAGLHLGWRWKVERSLSGNARERSRGGDDYAARILVGFERAVFDRDTRALCYVWAGQLPAGTELRSPYSANVATIVLESGDGRAGAWVSERRDLVADFRRSFGRAPRRLSGIAIVVDTDDTGGRARAWFDDLGLASDGGTADRD